MYHITHFIVVFQIVPTIDNFKNCRSLKKFIQDYEDNFIQRMILEQLLFFGLRQKRLKREVCCLSYF